MCLRQGCVFVFGFVRSFSAVRGFFESWLIDRREEVPSAWYCPESRPKRIDFGRQVNLYLFARFVRRLAVFSKDGMFFSVSFFHQGHILSWRARRSLLKVCLLGLDGRHPISFLAFIEWHSGSFVHDNTFVFTFVCCLLIFGVV